MIQNFVNQLNINLYILTNTETTKFKSDKQTDSPLVFVYQYDKRFGVPYHKEYDELDVNPNLNVECYPFILMNSTKKSNKKESTKISHIQREIIEEFASLLIGHGIIDLSESLKKQISGLIQGDPRYKHTRLQELIEKASKTESGVNPMTDGLSQSTASNNEKNVIKELDCIAPINQSLQSEVPDVKSAHPEECESCKLPINSDKILFECLHLIHPKCYTKCKLCPKCAKHL